MAETIPENGWLMFMWTKGHLCFVKLFIIAVFFLIWFFLMRQFNWLQFWTKGPLLPLENPCIRQRKTGAFCRIAKEYHI